MNQKFNQYKEVTMFKNLKGCINYLVSLLVISVLINTLYQSSAYACRGEDGSLPNFRSVPTDLSKRPRGDILLQIGFEPVLVILVDFNNCAGTYAQGNWNTILLTTNSPGSSMRDYYHEVSYHLTYNFPGLDLTPATEASPPNNNGVAGWYRLNFNHPHTTYGNDWMWRMGESLPGAPAGCRTWSLSQQIAFLAFQAADSNVNYWAFQMDPVPDLSISTDELHTVIIVAGFEASYSGAPNPKTWRHHWAIPGTGYWSQDGPYGACCIGGANYGGGYSMVGEKAPNGTIIGMGLVAHEIGHDIGLPDLYDTDGSTNGYGEGAGKWCLMAGGDWLGNPFATKPGHFSAWAKIDRGWLTPTKLWNKDSLNAQIPAVETLPKIYRMNPYNQQTSKQYFLIENRQLRGFDAALPGSGLLIYQVDDSMIGMNRSSNRVNSRVGYTNNMHYGVDVECQDGFPVTSFRDDLDTTLPFNRGDTGDPWIQTPYFTPLSTPNTDFYYSVQSYVAVESISNSGNVMTANLIYKLTLDVGVTQIVAPTGMVRKDSSVAASAIVKNFGTDTVSFNAVMTVDTWTRTANVNNLISGEQRTVSFGNWLASQAGTFTVKCSTQLTGDLRTINDLMIDSVIVSAAGKDVGVVAIKSPTGIIDSGQVITPTCSVYNYGTTTESYNVRMKIGSFYDTTALVFSHTPGTYQYLTFPTWNANQVGTHTVSCSTELSGDVYTTNDKRTGSVEVRRPGAPPSGWFAMASIPTAPSGKRPKSGSCMAGLEATGLIYFLKASNKNDFYSYDPNTNTWTPLETIPKGDKATNDGKNPKKGSAMAPYEDAVYALRGNNTLGFWKYIAVADTGETLGWKKMADFPTGAKRVKDGSGLVTVTKGGNDYLFAARGAKQSDFYLYDMAEDSWIKVTSPPVGQSGKTGYKKGSCMAYDGEYVYVLQGYYGSFFRYKVEADSWFELRQYSYKIFLNRDGKKKKPKDGAALVYYNNNVYMLKGGNTNEVWMYSIAADSWSQMNENWDIPLGASNRKVKGGGGLIMFGDMSKDPTLGGFFVSKGANTDEFYRHELPSSAQLPSSAGACPQPVSGACYSARIESEFPSYQLKITPNPAINVTAVRYTLPRAGLVSFKLYDITGAIRLRQTITNPTKDGVFFIDAKALTSGVYILRFNAGDIRVTKKLVIEK